MRYIKLSIYRRFKKLHEKLKIIQSEITAKLLDFKMLDAFLNSMNPCLISQKGGRVLGQYYNGVGLGVDRHVERCHNYFTRPKWIETKDTKVLEMTKYIHMAVGLKAK